MKEIKAIIQPFMLEKVVNALVEIEGLPGITVSTITGFGKSWSRFGPHKQFVGRVGYVQKTKLEIVVPDELVEQVVSIIQKNAHTGNTGDGKIFVIPVEEVVKIRTGERGEAVI